MHMPLRGPGMRGGAWHVALAIVLGRDAAMLRRKVEFSRDLL